MEISKALKTGSFLIQYRNFSANAALILLAIASIASGDFLMIEVSVGELFVSVYCIGVSVVSQ